MLSEARLWHSTAWPALRVRQEDATMPAIRGCVAYSSVTTTKGALVPCEVREHSEGHIAKHLHLII